MGWNWLVIGAVAAALSVAAGAFGAHSLAARLDLRSLELWETAARYLMYAALAQMATGLLARGTVSRWPDRAGLALLVGSVVFSGTVGALALGAPRWLGAVTPLGGVALIAGFLLLAVAARRPA